MEDASRLVNVLGSARINLGPLARVTGHHGISAEYHGDLTLAEVKPLPPQIVALIPALAAAQADEPQP